MRDTKFNENDDLPDVFPNDLTHEIFIEEADILAIKKLYELVISENDSIKIINKSEDFPKLLFLEKYKDQVALRSRAAGLWI